MQFLTHFLSFGIPEWLLLEQAEDCDELFIFLDNEKWNNFSKGEKMVFAESSR